MTGTVPRGGALLRSGAGVGDDLYVSDSIGAALAARRWLDGDSILLPSMNLESAPDVLRAYPAKALLGMSSLRHVGFTEDSGVLTLLQRF